MDKDFELISDFKTWKSDNTGIFDYTSADVTEVNHTTDEEDTYYCRKKASNKIRNYKKNIEITKDHIILFRARKNNKKQYELINVIRKKMKKNIDNLNNLDHKMWLVINSENIENKEKFAFKNKSYSLMENDIIKLGRKKYEIIKLNVPMNPDPYIEQNSLNDSNKRHGPVFDIQLKPNQYFNEIIQKVSNESVNKDDSDSSFGYNPEKDCRICFGSDSTEENPKLKICNCHNYIHYNCIKQFLKNRITMSENSQGTVTSYYCNKFNCEVCEEPFPLKFTIKFNENSELRTYYLIDGLELPENTNYLILESLTYLKENQNVKNVFVVKLQDSEITLGRSDKNDIIDNDVSVSRHHAAIKFNQENGEITIINKSSKFGVLVLIKDNLKLFTDEKVYLQVGRTFVNLVQKEKKQETEKEEEEEIINE
jgi:hypothetical protein